MVLVSVTVVFAVVKALVANERNIWSIREDYVRLLPRLQHASGYSMFAPMGCTSISNHALNHTLNKMAETCHVH
ncbi:hypothetical protein CDAR_586441 [Caerostris darwini]|uniref:Secreted protein n=1 Tax=Caerostris darwini TaxID=1538125 RepID=A0AAV4Q695_9ARAC|nr:hypothetical protein CDAR_586441 [Caerostris darwini]